VIDLRKKLFWACLFVSVALCLSSCGGNEENSASESAAPATSGESTSSSDVSSVSAPAPQLTAFEKLFQNGPMAAKNENDLWGFIDNTGEYVIQPVYSDVRVFGQNGLAVVKEESSGLWGVIDTSGNYTVEPKFSGVVGSFSEGLLCVYDSGGCGYIDESGTYVIQPQFLSAHAFSGGLAQVSTSIERMDEFNTYYSYTYVNKSGELITDEVFGEAYDFSEGRALVKAGDPIYGYYGYLDESGKFIVPPQFDEATSFSDGIAFAHDAYSGKTVLLDLDGNILAESTMFDVSTSSGSKARWYSDLCPVKLSDGTGQVYINKQGEIVLPKSGVPYRTAGDFYYDGFAFAGQDTGVGLIDLAGNWIIEPQYSTVYNSNVGGVVQMGNAGVMRLFDFAGNCLMEYHQNSRERPIDEMRYDPMAVAKYADDGSIIQAGYMNHDGSMAIDYIFEDARNFSYDYSYAKAQSGGLWGLIDKNGDWLIPARFTQFMAAGRIV